MTTKFEKKKCFSFFWFHHLFSCILEVIFLVFFCKHLLDFISPEIDFLLYLFFHFLSVDASKSHTEMTKRIVNAVECLFLLSALTRSSFGCWVRTLTLCYQMCVLTFIHTYKGLCMYCVSFFLFFVYTFVRIVRSLCTGALERTLEVSLDSLHRMGFAMLQRSNALSMFIVLKFSCGAAVAQSLSALQSSLISTNKFT